MSGEFARLLGAWGEGVVAQDLRKKGWTIIAANYRCRMGEIDLVAEKKPYLSFVVVKLRKIDLFASASDNVTTEKQRKVKAAALFFMNQHKTDLQPRFDVAEIYAPNGWETEDPEINYIENAF